MKSEVVLDAIDALHAMIVESLSPSRERSLALTKLDECRMWFLEALIVEACRHEEE